MFCWSYSPLDGISIHCRFQEDFYLPLPDSWIPATTVCCWMATEKLLPEISSFSRRGLCVTDWIVSISIDPQERWSIDAVCCGWTGFCSTAWRVNYLFFCYSSSSGGSGGNESWRDSLFIKHKNLSQTLLCYAPLSTGDVFLFSPTRSDKNPQLHVVHS